MQDNCRNHATAEVRKIPNKTLWDNTFLDLKQVVNGCVPIFKVIIYKSKKIRSNTLSVTFALRLKLTNTELELELFTDKTIYKMCEKENSGGIYFVVSSRYKKANHKYINPG